jgi:hypothetical protein
VLASPSLSQSIRDHNLAIVRNNDKASSCFFNIQHSLSLLEKWFVFLFSIVFHSDLYFIVHLTETPNCYQICQKFYPIF